ncbi:uncharacterized protein K02A2.6-like [Ornithodoros turicata]|uniref:uncharacterized protein K02A2.6-like n=1 Tax=Ornithodoros turicata TaxID=34597 RepID=UPI003138A055
MKACARSYIWWSGLDRDIEEIARECNICGETQKALGNAPQPHWEHPNSPWSTIHLDFAGPVDGHTYLAVVDAYSKWAEVREVKNPNSATVVEILRSLFAAFGIPKKVVSDNGTAFVSEEIRDFNNRNGIKYVTSATYHPATNKQAERMVGELKRALSRGGPGTLACRISRFLSKQHTTCHAKTGNTPARLMFGRELPSLLDALKPAKDTPNRCDELPKSRTPVDGQVVLVKNFTGKPAWLQGRVVRRVGQRSWIVQTANGDVRRHIDHIKLRQTIQPTCDYSCRPLLTWDLRHCLVASVRS